MKSYYTVENPDLQRSPYTGLNRDHWVAIGKWFLGGIFSHVSDFDEPIFLKNPSGQAEFEQARKYTVTFEGLSRSFFMAAPLIAEDADLEVNGICLRKYYAHHILNLGNPKSKSYVGSIKGNECIPHIVEGGGLVIGLMHCKEQVWDQYSKKEQDKVAAYIYRLAHRKTISHNYRFFSVLMATFLKVNGYAIDENMLKDHLYNLSLWYAGDGWYRDGILFNYYCPWAFHLYAPIWCQWYGYEHEPVLAKQFEERYHEFMKTYPSFFGKDGSSLLWGRSIAYRFAASAAIPAGNYLENSGYKNFGEMRRICSGNLLQFITKKGFLENGVPSLGFYGSFDPVVQGYISPASTFWCAKLFLALHMPAEHPFWKSKETNHLWEKPKKKFSTKMLTGPALQVTNFYDNGTTELRTAKVRIPDLYNTRLAFNSHFQADEPNAAGITGMQYSIHFKEEKKSKGKSFVHKGENEGNPHLPKRLLFSKEEGGVLYRQIQFGDTLLWDFIDLAEIIVPGGVIRVDRFRLNYGRDVYLGHYSLPHKSAKEPVVDISKNNCSIQASLNDQHLVMVNLHGWGELNIMTNTNKNPETKKSSLLYARHHQKCEYQNHRIFACVMLHKIGSSKLTKKELNIVKSFEPLEFAPSGSPGGAKLTLSNGKKYVIDFGNIEGNILE